MLQGLMLLVLLVPGEHPAPSDPRLELQICESGGWRAQTCAVTCHRVFNYWTTTCNVSCRSGYYACCSCDGGCECVLDHDELWPVYPTPMPEPDPDPEDLV